MMVRLTHTNQMSVLSYLHEALLAYRRGSDSPTGTTHPGEPTRADDVGSGDQERIGHPRHIGMVWIRWCIDQRGEIPDHDASRDAPVSAGRARMALGAEESGPQ